MTCGDREAGGTVTVGPAEPPHGEHLATQAFQGRFKLWSTPRRPGCPRQSWPLLQAAAAGETSLSPGLQAPSGAAAWALVGPPLRLASAPPPGPHQPAPPAPLVASGLWWWRARLSSSGISESALLRQWQIIDKSRNIWARHTAHVNHVSQLLPRTQSHAQGALSAFRLDQQA